MGACIHLFRGEYYFCTPHIFYSNVFVNYWLHSSVLCTILCPCSKECLLLVLFFLRFVIFWEFITVFFPTLLCFTVLADHVYAVLITLLSIILLSLLLVAGRPKTIPFTVFKDLPYPHRSPAVSFSRTWVNIFTVVAILGVDFNIFPRRFAKVETYGVGVMDVGVGCYMICHGSTAHEARFAVGFQLQSYFRSLLRCLKKVLPYLVIGLFRTVSVKVTDYQQHVSEYGVHWNFFITLACVKVKCSHGNYLL